MFNKRRLASLAFIGICSLCFALRGYFDQTHTLQSMDFKPVYSGARCLLRDCDPYNASQLRRQYVQAGGTFGSELPFRQGSANYPPTTLFFILPYAMLPWAAGHIAWLLTIAISLAGATFLAAALCEPGAPPAVIACMGVFLATSTLLMMNGQPAGVAIGLCVFATWCLLAHRWPWPAVVCFSLSLVLKPQTGAFLWVYFAASAAYRWRALQILLATLVLSAPGLIWASVMPASRRWFYEFTAVVGDIAVNGNQPADPQAIHFANLQSLLSVFRNDVGFYNAATWAIVAVIWIPWLYCVIKARPSRAKDFCAVAAIASLSLLPVYHREYDTRLLLLIFPATALLLRQRRVAGTVSLVLAAILTIITSPTYVGFLEKRKLSSFDPRHLARTALLGRGTSIVLLLLSVTFLVALFQVTAAARPMQQDEE